MRDTILSGRLAAGARLRQEDLAAQLGISRTPIREALGRLQHEGLVELLPRAGVRVAMLALDEAVELYELREVLDGLAARLAANRADGPAVRRIEKALARMADCVARGDANHWFVPHVAFHEAIVAAAANRPLARLTAVVRLSIRRFHPLLLTVGDRLAQAYGEHRGVYEAIAARDAEVAERLARAHIANAREIALKVMTEGDRHAAVQAR